MSDATLVRMKAMADLETNMENLEKIIVQKDYVIDGLRRTLDKAFSYLEGGAADKLRKEHDSLLTETDTAILKEEKESSLLEEKEKRNSKLQMIIDK